VLRLFSQSQYVCQAAFLGSSVLLGDTLQVIGESHNVVVVDSIGLVSSLGAERVYHLHHNALNYVKLMLIGVHQLQSKKMPNLFQETVESPNPQALRIFLELLALKGSVLASKRRLFASRKRLFASVFGVFWGASSSNLPSGKHTENYGKSQFFFMGKSTINGNFQ